MTLNHRQGVRRQEQPPAGTPDLPTMLGLRSPLVGLGAAILVLCYSLANWVTAGAAYPGFWLAHSLALILQIFALAAVCLLPGDPLGRGASIVIMVSSLAGLGVAWWQSTADSQWWVQVTVPPAMTAVIAAILVLRGRGGLAWLTVIGAGVIALIWTFGHDVSQITAFSMINRIVWSVLPASIMALMVRPLLLLLDSLREREVAAAEQQAAAEATAAERNERLAAMADEVTVLLNRVADGESFDAADAMSARLIEAALRDEVRGRGWDSAGVRSATAAARARGVKVDLFDDGGLEVADLRAADAERLRGELIRVLDDAAAGRLTARIKPPGRELKATITLVDESGVRRRECRYASTGLRWETS